jgi:glycogen debranching enzyme
MPHVPIVSLTILLLSGTSTVAIEPMLSKEDTAFLKEIVEAVLQESRVAPGASVAGAGPNTSGGTLIRPGGRDDYPAFWIRDYAMSLDAGLITIAEQRHALFVTATHQPDEEIKLPTGAVLPPGSIPDHVSFGGVPIFFPGVLQDYDLQGGGQWGQLPSLDDQFFFVHMASEYLRQSSDAAFLKKAVRGKPLLQRLAEAYAMPPSRPGTGLVYTTEEIRGVNFGFFDTVVHTGDLFFASLLKFRAARELATLCEAAGQPDQSRTYREEADRLRQAFIPVFQLSNGWFRASTGLSAQIDVWGTAFAVYIGALAPEAERAACAALAKALRKETIAWKGSIRHVPTDADFGPASAWERAYAAKNRYQNGAYWPTPTGWVCFAVAKVDKGLAQKLAREYLEELREGDFRKDAEHGSPWECMHPDGQHRQNPVYLTSVTAPLAAFQRTTGDQTP